MTGTGRRDSWQPTVEPLPRRRGLPLRNNPKVRAAVYQLILLAAGAVVRLRVRAQCQGQSGGAQDHRAASASSKTPPDLASISRSFAYQRSRHLRPRVRRGAAQHAAGGGHRDRARDRSRICHRDRPAVAQLAGCPARRRLCRADPQPAAPVPDPVLVSRRARHAAGAAPEHLDLRGDFHQQSRESSCPRRWPAREPATSLPLSRWA